MRRDITPYTVPETEVASTKNKRNIPQVMRNMNSTGEDEDHTLIHLSTWIRRNTVVNEEVEHTIKEYSYSYKDIKIKRKSTHQTNKYKCSIV